MKFGYVEVRMFVLGLLLVQAANGKEMLDKNAVDNLIDFEHPSLDTSQLIRPGKSYLL